MNDLIGSGDLGKRFIICGDFNCPGPVNTRGLINTELLHLIEEHNLHQHVHIATCRTENILDHVFTCEDNNIVDNVAVHDVNLSDHYLVTCRITEPLRGPPAISTRFRCWKRLDTDEFKCRVLKSSAFLERATTAETFAEQMEQDICRILDDLIPMREFTRRIGKLRNRWLSTEAKNAKQERRRLERKWKSTGLESVRQAYRKVCKLANKLIKDSFHRSYSERVRESSHDPKKLWQTVKGLLHTSHSSHNDQPELCQAFASFMTQKIDKVKTSVASYISQAASPIATPDRAVSVPPLTILAPASVAEVRRLIAKLPNKTSPLDYIHTSVLKSCIDVFAPLITHLANLSFSEGCFPNQFKQAQVTPLLKKSGLDQSDPANYRPISNLNTIGKIIERLFLARLLPHVAETGNFNPLQSAYRKNHSTETALLKILDDLYRIIDSKNAAVLIGLDLSAAFDTINHSMLLDRIQHTFGLTGSAHDWLQSYLSNRSQYVKVGNTQSVPSPVIIGVPQGSVLGPFLFSIYVSPIADIIASHGVKFHQYADDTQLYTAVKSGSDTHSIKNLESCCCAVRDWFAKNGMLLNPDKSEVLLVARKSVAKTFADGSGISVAGSDITFSIKLKSLGVTLDQNLSFDQHVQNTVKASNFHIRALRHIRPHLDKTVANTVACSIVTSRLDYCNSLLYNTSAANIKKLQRVQNSLARVVAGTKRRDHISPVLQELHWLPIEQRIKYKIALITHRAFHEQQPPYLAEIAVKHQPSRNLRSGTQNRLAKPKEIFTSLGSQSFTHAAETEWNKLPDELRKTESTISFKKKLKTTLFKEIYSL